MNLILKEKKKKKKEILMEGVSLQQSLEKN